MKHHEFYKKRFGCSEEVKPQSTTVTAEYIDRAVVIKYIEKKLDKLTDVPEMGVRTAAMGSAYNSTLNYIMQVPAADVVAVVRCKNCIYNENGICIHSEFYNDKHYRPDYFCADGIRKDV